MNFSGAFLVWISVANLFLNSVIGSNSTVTTTDSSNNAVDEDFFTSNMFLGLAIGGGSFLALVTCLCILWKCTCGREDDDEEADDKKKGKPKKRSPAIANTADGDISNNRSRRTGRVTPVIVV